MDNNVRGGAAPQNWIAFPHGGSTLQMNYVSYEQSLQPKSIIVRKLIGNKIFTGYNDCTLPSL
jgi:hypothetical protein